MEETRLSFLKQATCGAVGLGCGFPLLGAACTRSASNQHGAADEGETSIQWAMVVDIRKCLQEDVRSACIEACHREHNVPDISDPEEEVKWVWTEEFKHAFPDQIHDHMQDDLNDSPVLVLCNHCSRPSCVRVCPTGATWKRESDGVVMMDMHRCIGCRYCMAACPYGARSFNWRDPREFVKKNENGELPATYPSRSKGVVEKCTFCAERLRVGDKPVCVEAAAKVPGGEGALTFGDVTDRDSEVSRILRENRTICRRVSLGTGPKVFYIV